MSTQILVDGPDAPAHFTNCGADLSVIRMSACCEAPRHNALPESPKSDASASDMAAVNAARAALLKTKGG